MVISYFKFLVSMVSRFLLKCKKCPKMGSKCQNFASLRAKITIFGDIKHIIKIKSIPRNGVNRCIEIAPIDL